MRNKCSLTIMWALICKLYNLIDSSHTINLHEMACVNLLIKDIPSDCHAKGYRCTGTFYLE